MEGRAGIRKLYAIATYAATIRLTLKSRPVPQVAAVPLPNLKTAPKLTAARTTVFEGERVSRDYEPVPGQWYENLEEEEPFRVLTMDEDDDDLDDDEDEDEAEDREQY